MSELLNIRNKIRDFFRKFDEITMPIIRFIFAYAMFSSINSLFGYSDLFERGIVVFLLALISSLVPNAVVVFLGGVVIMVNVFTVGTEVAIAFAALFIVIYCTYMRMFPDCCWVLALVPIMYCINMQFAVPVIVVIFAGISGIVPAAFGAVLYYFAQATREISDMIKASSEEEVKAFSYLVDNVVKNKEVLLTIVVFAVVIAVGYVVYRLPVDFAFYIGIVACGAVSIISYPVCSGILDVQGEGIGKVILGSLVGILIGAVAQFFKGILDYAHKESVQFEDDEYYYYVKAVPKYDVAETKRVVKKITDEGEVNNLRQNVQNNTERRRKQQM